MRGPRRGIEWGLSEGGYTDLIESAVAMAVSMRGALPERMIVRADREAPGPRQGSWLGSLAHGRAQSVGRPGVCGEDVQAETFWATSKVEI